MSTLIQPLNDCPLFWVDQHPLILHKVTHLRAIEADQQLFAKLVRELSLLLAHAALQNLPLVPQSVQTPLEITQGYQLANPWPVLVPVLRAGLGMLQPLQDLLPYSPVAHLGIRRDEKTLQPEVYYQNIVAFQKNHPSVLVLDPMLATGGSTIAAVSTIKKHTQGPITLLNLLAAPEGVRAVYKAHPDVRIFSAALDRQLNDQGYIVPGLGDAGDRLFGTSIRY